MIIKYGSAKIIEKYESTVAFLDKLDSNVAERYEKIIASYEPIRLDKERFYYIRNRSVSSLETWGPNGNGDGFPRVELENNHHTFVNSRVSVDHQPNIVIGMVIDSVFVPPQIQVINGMLVKTGDFVENILAIDKKAAESFRPGFIELLEDGKITDTSMGAMVGYSICSVPTCLHIASTPEEYCEHIRHKKNSFIVVAGDMKVQVYEICRNVTFFEDSIIVPLELGGLAGGAGADPHAKIVQKIASTPLKKYIKVPDIIKEADERPPVVEHSFKDEDIQRTIERIEKGMQSDVRSDNEVQIDNAVKQKVFDYVLELLKKGVDFDEAIKAAWEQFKGMAEKSSSLKRVAFEDVDKDEVVVTEEEAKRIGVVIVDFDNTVAQEVEKDNLMVFEVNPDVIKQVKDIAKKENAEIFVVTGRNQAEDRLRAVLDEQFGKDKYHLFMYPHEDKEPEKIAEWKASVIDPAKHKVIAIFEDNSDNLNELWRFFPDAIGYIVKDGKPVKQEPIKESLKRVLFE